MAVQTNSIRWQWQHKDIQTAVKIRGQKPHTGTEHTLSPLPRVAATPISAPWLPACLPAAGNLELSSRFQISRPFLVEAFPGLHVRPLTMCSLNWGISFAALIAEMPYLFDKLHIYLWHHWINAYSPLKAQVFSYAAIRNCISINDVISICYLYNFQCIF